MHTPKSFVQVFTRCYLGVRSLLKKPLRVYNRMQKHARLKVYLKDMPHAPQATEPRTRTSKLDFGGRSTPLCRSTQAYGPSAEYHVRRGNASILEEELGSWYRGNGRGREQSLRIARLPGSSDIESRRQPHAFVGKGNLCVMLPSDRCGQKVCLVWHSVSALSR